MVGKQGLYTAGGHRLSENGGLLLRTRGIMSRVGQGLGRHLIKRGESLGGRTTQNLHVGLSDRVGNLTIYGGRKGHDGSEMQSP